MASSPSRMFYNSYLDIQHLDKPAIHPGGLCEFFFAKLEDVEIWPQLNPQTSTYTEEVILRAGASWYRCQVIDPERDYKEESKTAEGGPYVDVRLAGFLPDDSPLNTVTIAGMMLHDYVIVLQERNGMRRLIGNEDAGAKFTHSYDSSDGDGTRGRQLVFTFKSTAPSGIYLSAVTADGDIVNPPWPGGGGPETDPTVPIWVKNIAQVQIANWNAAFGWGNHADAGYLTKVLADGYYSPLGHTHSLAQLTDVNISGLLGNQLLRYDAGAGRWVNWTPDFSPMGHTHNFSELLNIPSTIEGYGITDLDTFFDTDYYTAIVDGENEATFVSRVGWHPVLVMREFLPLKKNLFTWDQETGKITLPPELSMEAGQTLFILFIKKNI